MFKNFILIFCFLAIACSPGRNEKIIPEDTMANLLADIHFTDAVIHVMQTRKHTEKAVKESLYQAVFDKYGISPEDYRNSLAYYAEKPAKLDQIYDKVFNKLNQLENMKADTLTKGQP